MPRHVMVESAHPRRFLFGLIAIVVFALAQAGGEKTDVVVLRNGDHVTGETKELYQGLLKYKTDSMSTVYVEWVDVVRLVSTQMFRVEVRSGEFYFGSLQEPDQDYHLHVGIGEFDIELNTAEVVRIYPVKKGFWAGVDGSVAVGAQYASSTQVLQYSLTANADRRTRKYLSQSNLRLALSRTAEEPTKQNNDLGFSQSRFLGRRYAAGGKIQFQQNDELGVAFRILISGIGSRSVLQTLRQRAAVSVGLGWNREDILDGGTNESLEGVLSANWNVFKFKTPKTNLNASAAVYPSITESGRVRTQADITLTQELIKDFSWNFSCYSSTDNKPPNEMAASSDWGVTTGLGYTF